MKKPPFSISDVSSTVLIKLYSRAREYTRLELAIKGGRTYLTT